MNKMAIKQQINLDFGTAQLREDGILSFIPNNNVKGYTLEQLKEMLTTFKTITKGKSHPYYSDNSMFEGKFTSEAKTFMSKHFHEFATAFAMKENSSILRYVTHTFIYLNKPNIPVKMFKTEKEAIKWLKTIS